MQKKKKREVTNWCYGVWVWLWVGMGVSTTVATNGQKTEN
jgi:hypothetical protein